MALVKHSPPKKGVKSPKGMEQSQSVPNITQAVIDPEFINVAARHKHPRLDDSLTDHICHKLPRLDDSTTVQLEEFKLEIKQMLSSWKHDHDEAIAKAMKEQTALVSKLVSELAEMKLQNIQIQNKNAEIERSIIATGEFYDDMKKQLKVLQDECREYKKYSESLEKTVKDLQYKSRSSTVEVRNIPLQPNETTADLIKIISNIGNAVNYPITATNVRDIHRITGNSTSQAIVAEFLSVQAKTELISRVRGFNNKHPNKEHKLNTQLIGLAGQKQPVYVDEHLPLSAKKLFYMARSFAKQHDFILLVV